MSDVLPGGPKGIGELVLYDTEDDQAQVSVCARGARVVDADDMVELVDMLAKRADENGRVK
jgi:hypothetical protein